MVFRDRQGLSPSAGDPKSPSTNRDRYLDDCFLLCMNRQDNTDLPEIHRLESNLMRELCNKNPSHQMKSQQQSRLHVANRRGGRDYETDDEDIVDSKQHKERDYMHRRKGNQQDRDFQTVVNRSRYQRDDDTDDYQYSRLGRYNPRDDYNVMQHSDDELSVYEVYVPTNTLNRLSDKRIDNNMVLIDYEDVSMMRDLRPTSSPYGYSPRNVSSQYHNHVPSNQYNAYSPQYQNDSSAGFPRGHDGQQQLYQNNPSQEYQRLGGGYYGNEGDRQPYSPQSGPFLPVNVPIDHSNAINVRRHIYSPSQLPQGLTEGQLAMLLQKGNQYQSGKSQPPEQQTQLFPSQKEQQPSTTSAVTVSQQHSAVPNTHLESFKNHEYIASPVQTKLPQVPPQIIDHRLIDEEKTSVIDELTKPMSTLNTTHSIKPSRDIESKESDEKKKDKSSDLKKDKKTEKDAGESHKKDSKKEKSSGKDSKKKKKK